MTSWTSILNAAVAVGGIPSSSTVTALRDNVAAAAEAASGAPVVAAGWHPYDKVTIGDGKTGLIYDFAVNGAVGSVVTPDFVDGYEYRMIIDAFSHSSGASRAFSLSVYMEGAASYDTFYTSAALASGSRLYFDIEIPIPRVTLRRHLVRFVGSTDGTVITETVGVTSTLNDKILKAKIEIGGGSSSDDGKVYVFRRREYASSP
jgi:hypothetical protein